MPDYILFLTFRLIEEGRNLLPFHIWSNTLNNILPYSKITNPFGIDGYHVIWIIRVIGI